MKMLSRVEKYLSHRRSLGYKLKTEGQMLLNFARYADDSGHRGPLNHEIALRWSTLPSNADRLYHARRLEVVRGFAKYQIAWEPKTRIPHRHILGPAHRRNTPHIYTAEQIHQLLKSASFLSGDLRPLTYQTLFGLLACCGLRISETLNIRVHEVDLQNGVITISKSKYHQSRFVPLHPSAISPLKRYVCQRQLLFPAAEFFFVSDRGCRFAYSTVQTTFRQLTRDFISNSGRRYVRLHDLRHTFACRVLLRWQQSKKGAQGRIPILSRYLGHLSVTDTYWYLTAIPELLTSAAKKFNPPSL
jgi:integrase